MMTGPKNEVRSEQADRISPLGRQLHILDKACETVSLWKIATCSTNPTPIVQAELKGVRMYVYIIEHSYINNKIMPYK